MADTVSNRIPEWKLQAAMAAALDGRIALSPDFAYAASLEGAIGNLNPYQAQLAIATGVKRGEPDLRLYFAGARIVFAEVKEATQGKLTPSQKERIPILRALGFTVHIVRVASEAGARSSILAIVDAELAGGSAAMDSALYWPGRK